MVYLTRGGSVQRPLASRPRGWPAGPTPWPASQVLGRFGPWLHGHMSTREEEGGGSYSTRQAGHMARPVGQHMASYSLGQVSGAPPWPYK
jgi:hypothetical protein